MQVEAFLEEVSVLDCIKLLSVSAPVRLALLRRLGKLDPTEFQIPLSLVFKSLTKAAKDEIRTKAEAHVLGYDRA